MGGEITAAITVFGVDYPETPENCTRNEPVEKTEKRTLAADAVSESLKNLYGTRVARPDLLRAMQGPARRITKWTRADGESLRKLVFHICSALD